MKYSYLNLLIFLICVSCPSIDKKQKQQLIPPTKAEEQKYLSLVPKGYRVHVIHGVTTSSGYLSRGVHGVVYLVIEEDTKDLWAAKFQAFDDPGDGVPPEKEVERLQQLKLKIGERAVEIKRIKNCTLKRYVEGRTLRLWIASGDLFKKENSLIRKDLLDFYRETATRGVRVEDVNNGNLLFSEQINKWVVIDSEGADRDLLGASAHRIVQDYLRSIEFDLSYQIDLNQKMSLEIISLIEEIQSLANQLKEK